MKLERDLLQKEIFPEIKKYCRGYGWEFEGIDLRWGISREAGYNQRTMQICLNELHRCQTISPKPNFLVLIGDRYGWIPLPEYINPQEMDELESIATEEEVNILHKWYILDDNYLPSGLYILKPREVEDNINYFDDEVYNRNVYNPLRTLFEHYAEISKNNNLRIRFNSSATEQEIFDGALKCNDSDHIMIFERILTDVSTVEAHRIFLEDNNREKLRSLKNSLFKKTKKKVTIRTRYDNYGSKEYIDSFCAQLKEMIVGIIENEIKNYIEQSPLELDKELVWTKVKELVKHDVSSDSCIKIEKSNDNKYYSLIDIIKYKTILANNEICYNSVTRMNMIICQGGAGSGKSNLLAKTALILKQSDNDVIIRIVEYNERLSSGLLLLQSIWEEMNELYPTGKDFSEENIRDMIVTLDPKRPLYIIIDGLDRYHINDPIYNYGWLPPNWTHSIFVVCSVTSENYIAMNNSIRLHIKDNLSPEEAVTLVVNELRLCDRRLTDVQYNGLLEYLNSCNRKALSFSNMILLANVLKRCDSATLLQFGDGENCAQDYITDLSDPKNHGVMCLVMLLVLSCLRQGMSVDEFCSFVPQMKMFWDYYIKNEFINKTELPTLPTSICIRILNDIESIIDYQYISNKYLFSLKNTVLVEYIQKYKDEVNDIKKTLIFFFMNMLYGKREYGNVAHALNEVSYMLSNYDDLELVESFFCSLYIIALKYMYNVADLIRNDYSRLLSKPIGNELRKSIHELLCFDNMVSNYIANMMHGKQLSRDMTLNVIVDLASGYAPGTLIRKQLDEFFTAFKDYNNFTPYMYNTMGYKGFEKQLMRSLPCKFNKNSQLLYPYVLWKNSNVENIIYIYNLETFTRISISFQEYKNLIVRILDGEVFLIGNRSFSYMNFNLEFLGYSRIELTSHGYKTKYISGNKIGDVLDAVVCKRGDDKYRFAFLEEKNFVEIVDSVESSDKSSSKKFVDISRIKFKELYKIELVGFICRGSKLVIKFLRNDDTIDGRRKFKSIVGIYDSETFTLVDSESYDVSYINMCPVAVGGNTVAFGVGHSVVWYDYCDNIMVRNSKVTSQALRHAPVYFLSVSYDGQKILSMCGDNRLNSIDVKRKDIRCLVNFPNSTPAIIGHENRFLANLSGYINNETECRFDKLLLLDNCDNFLESFPPAIFSISADTEGKHIIVSSGYLLRFGNQGITRYDYSNGNIKYYEENDGSFQLYARATAVSPDNNFYAYSRGNFIVYKDFCNKYRKIFKFEPYQQISSEHIVNMKFTPDGKSLLAYMGADNEMIKPERYYGMLFRINGNETGPIKEYIHSGKFNEYWMNPDKIDFSPDGRYAIITDNIGYQCVDLCTGKTLSGDSCWNADSLSMQKYTGWLPDGFIMRYQRRTKVPRVGELFSISPSGGVALVEYEEDIPCIFWGYKGKINHKIKLTRDNIYSISWCFDGLHFFVIGEKYVWLYDTVKNRVIQKFALNYNGVENKKNIRYYKNRLHLTKVDYINGIIFYNGDKIFRLEPSLGYRINHNVICNITHLWDHEMSEYKEITTCCPACGKRFTPPEFVLETIKEINRNIDNSQSPIMTLPDEVWMNNNLVGHSCPNCGVEIKFNPFISHRFSAKETIPIINI